MLAERCRPGRVHARHARQLTELADAAARPVALGRATTHDLRAPAELVDAAALPVAWLELINR